jgi:tetratricopeptide (TPR) repeat protein
MFFPKLRRKAKWVFAFLALAFGLAFTVAGVGSGFGSGLGDYLSDLLGTTPGQSDQPDAGEAREAIKENPKNAQAHLDLANALQAENDISGAIVALEKYVELEPNDPDGLQKLAGLYTLRAGEAEQRARAAQISGARAFFSSEISDPTSPLGQALAVPPITQFQQQDATQAFQTASLEARSAYAKEMGLWQKLTKLEPEEPNFEAQLARSAEQAGDLPTAIAAYERFLELSPDAPQAEQIKERIEFLKKQQEQQPPGVGGG